VAVCYLIFQSNTTHWKGEWSRSRGRDWRFSRTAYDKCSDLLF